MFAHIGRASDPIQTSHQSCRYSSVLPSAQDHLPELLIGVSALVMGADVHHAHLLIAITRIPAPFILNATALKASPHLVLLAFHSKASVQ